MPYAWAPARVSTRPPCAPPFPPSFPSFSLQVGSIEDLEAYYERLGTFTGLYSRAVYDRMAKTIPKAIVLCQVGGSVTQTLPSRGLAAAPVQLTATPPRPHGLASAHPPAP
jgi:hypothetical protein